MEDPAVKRIIALIDMDCFYCQVELRLNPSLAGKPVAVVQYNAWKQGGIIAVNYEARDRGVTRFMRGEEAKKVCPELCLPSVPSVRGKADLTRYRNAGVEVANVFTQFSDCVERASVDEAYIDLTSAIERRILDGNVSLTPEKLASTFVVGYSDFKTNDMKDRALGTAEWIKQLHSNTDSRNPDYRLAIGALIVEEIRSEVLKKTGFHCSAGISHNKILAKLVAGVHKPKCQTVIPHDNVPELYETVPIRKVRNLGGKFGKNVAESLNITLMSELYEFSKEELIEKFNAKNGTWLYNIARGIDHDPVTARLIADSIGCSKNFPGPTAIKTKEKLQHWLRDMTMEVNERLELDQTQNSRRAKLLTITFKQSGVASSRSCPLSSYKVDTISRDAFEILQKVNLAPHDSPAFHPPIEYLGISASKFTCIKSTMTNFLADKNKSTVAKVEKEVLDDDDGSSDDDNIDSETISSKVARSQNACKIESRRPSIKSYFTQRVAVDDSVDQPKATSSATLGDPSTSAAVRETGNVLKNSKNRETDCKEISSSTAMSSKAKNSRGREERKRPSIKSYFTQAANQLDETKPGHEPDAESSTVERSNTQEKGENLNEHTDAESGSSSTGTEIASSSTAAQQSFFARIMAKKEESPTKCQPPGKLADEDFEQESEPATVEADTKEEDDWWQTCSECSKKIHLSELGEHIDYHEAVKIHRTLNGKIQVKTAPPRQVKSHQSPVKKKRKIASKPQDQKSITNFFGILPVPKT